MQKLLIWIFSLFLIIGLACSKKSEDQKFREFSEQFLQEMFAFHPTRATGEGEHRYDHLLDDFSQESIQRQLDWLEESEKRLEDFNYPALSDQNKIDFEILLNQIRYLRFQLTKLKEYKNNPLVYVNTIGTGIYSLIVRNFAPLEDRMRNLRARLEEVPRVVEQAKANLENPPRIHTETAIAQTKGLLNLIEKTLPQFFKQVPDMRDSLNFVAGKVSYVLQQFQGWLEQDLLPRSNGDFRLGKKLFDEKLRFVLQSELSREEILKRAEAEYKRTREEMFEVARRLYKVYFPDKKLPKTFNEKDKDRIIRAVLRRLSDDHPSAETIVDQAKDYLRQITAFVREKDLVALPQDSIQVIVMPEFRRGTSTAYCESSGPLEKQKKTFYAVAPPPANWSKQQIESYYREYNNYMLQILTIHEAMPGHYVQLAHANQFDSPVRAIFASGTFVEGWAVYCERMMIESGYDGLEVELQQLKFYLRAVINAILDQKIHVEGMSRKEAMKLMMEGGFQEEGEAAGKWRRACLTSTQLSTYFVGAQEIWDIRRQYEKIKRREFNLREFHDTLLSYGSPAPKFVKRLLFEEE